MKRCTKCNLEKDDDCFHKQSNARFGLACYCISCSRLYHKSSTGLASHHKHRISEKGRASSRLSSKRYRAKEKKKNGKRK